MIVVLLLIGQAAGVDISFPVEDVADSPIYLTIPETLAVNTSLVTLQETSNCSSEDLVMGKFNGSFIGNKYFPAVSFFVFDPRPSPALLIVCIDGTSAGHLEYHSSPELLPETHPAFSKQTIEIRQFSNFGWSHRFPDIMCRGCKSAINTLSFKSVIPGVPACSGRREEHNPLSNITTKNNEPAHLFPFRVNVTETNILLSWTFSTERLSVYDDALVAITVPVQICFYSDPMAGSGIFLGTAEFVLSENDTSALVFFILFFAVLFPVVCVITTSLYCYKLKRHRQFVLSVKHFIQGIQLEREMLLVPAQQTDASSSSSSR